MKRLMVVIAVLLFSATAVAGVMENAAPYLPILKERIDKFWGNCQFPHVLAGQVEQESSWNPFAKLETSRELGRGLAQITVTPRFNVFHDAVKFPELSKWDWQTDPYSPGNQLTFIVLTDKANVSRVSKMLDPGKEQMAGALIAYNAGLGTVLQRNALAVQKGTANGKWFGGLDQVRLPTESRILYGKNLGELRNEYPVKVFAKAEKYKPYFKK